ncbi:hypothetical protein TRAPUB_10293 [Trametes pubescens]|uniref:Uncharacterized protein n=1 Tax=Trametes pubescens TaxID=154538 RepID=A0A1M2VZW8_TRAPU|nr:hypothetical protein TRAPUB_10293 [Trametes pubescens]
MAGTSLPNAGPFPHRLRHERGDLTLELPGTGLLDGLRGRSLDSRNGQPAPRAPASPSVRAAGQEARGILARRDGDGQDPACHALGSSRSQQSAARSLSARGRGAAAIVTALGVTLPAR